MKIVKKITIAELQEMAKNMYGDLVKADVDLNKNLIILDMGMHADGEAYLMDNGSSQEDLWGINLHPGNYGTDDFIEFDSMINIKPRQNNPSRDVLDSNIREKIKDLVMRVVNE